MVHDIPSDSAAPLAGDASSSFALTPPQATSSAPPHAHPALPLPPPPSSSGSRSNSQQIRTLPTKSEDILQLVSQSNSIQFIHEILVPTLHDLSEGKSLESSTGSNSRAKERERAQSGEQLLTCGEDTAIYQVEDADLNRMTAGLTYIISARLKVYQNKPSLHKDELFNFAIRLSSLGDDQQFYMVPKRVAQLAWGILRLAQHLKKVSIAIPAIQVLIQKSCSPGYFSSIYGAYLEACLIAKNFEAGVLVLDQVFLHLRSAGATYLDILTYYHHAGLISAALKDFGKAKQYFVTAVSLPTTSASAIQLACAKRAILCELLDTGKRIHFPRYTASTVTRLIDKNASAYNDLAKEYESSRWSNVREIAGKADFANDCNKGLIEQVLKSITKRRILQLKEIYSRMTINDLVSRVGPSSKETVETITAILGEMITSRAINAAITPGTTPATSIVTFSEDAAIYSNSSNTSFNQLAQVNHLASQLEEELNEMSRRLGISREYLKKQANMLEIGGKGKGGAGGGGGRMDEFDQLMAAEDYVGGAGGGGGLRGVGSNYGDMGF